MIGSEYNIHIRYTEFGRMIEVFVSRDLPGSQIEYLTIGASNTLITQTVLEGELVPDPFLKLPAKFFETFAKGVIQYAYDSNIKTERMTYLEGELDATKNHADILRSIISEMITPSKTLTHTPAKGEPYTL